MLFDSNQFVDYIIAKYAKPLRLRLAGFPSCGKTTISKIICHKLPKTRMIESEAWLYPLKFRIARDLSGAHPDSYDLEKCCKDLDDLAAGKEIAIRKYEHEVGNHVSVCHYCLSDGEGIILDGTPFFFEMFKKFTSNCIVLYPKDYDKWLELSVKRDVTTRFFSHAEATRLYWSTDFIPFFQIPELPTDQYVMM